MIPFGITTATTDHGGSIMATQQQAIVNGMAFLRAGDGFMCPKCKVWSTLLMNHQNIIMFDKPVAFAGDKFTCGATLLPNQSLAGGDTRQSSSNVKFVVSKQYDQKFSLKDGNGNPLINTPYSACFPDGLVIHGVTDDLGHTDRHSVGGVDNIDIHIGHI